MVPTTISLRLLRRLTCCTVSRYESSILQRPQSSRVQSDGYRVCVERRFMTTSKRSKPLSSHKVAQLRKRIADDVERAKELLVADVERTKDLAMHQVINVPNVITLTRIIATPYLGYLIWQGSYESATGVLALAAFSDWLDGFLARKLKQESILGSFLDPFADKLMIGALSISMLASGLLPFPLVLLIVGRDTLLVSGTLYHRITTKQVDSAFFDTQDTGAFTVAPTLLSKVNTLLQFVLFGTTLTNVVWDLPGEMSMQILMMSVGTTTVLSGAEYLRSYILKTGAFQPIQRVKEKENTPT